MCTRNVYNNMCISILYYNTFAFHRLIYIKFPNKNMSTFIP